MFKGTYPLEPLSLAITNRNIGVRMIPNNMMINTNEIGLLKNMSRLPWEMMNDLRMFDSNSGASTNASNIGAVE